MQQQQPPLLLYNSHVLSYYTKEQELAYRSPWPERDRIHRALVRELLHAFRAKQGQNPYEQYDMKLVQERVE